MTSLTATPSQLGRLGLISKKSAKALDNPSHAGSTLTTSTPDNLGTSSGDEAMQTLAADHQLMDGAKPKPISQYGESPRSPSCG